MRSIALGWRGEPPAAATPISGGTAPEYIPGRAARGERVFNGVYIMMYQRCADMPSTRGCRELSWQRNIEPVRNVSPANVNASALLIVPDGRGLRDVLGIFESLFSSRIWLNTHAEELRRIVPRNRMRISLMFIFMSA